jgi:hypothetical protein
MIALVDVGWIWHPCMRRKGRQLWSLNCANHFDCKRFKANIRNSRVEISAKHSYIASLCELSLFI